jgi:hypothetical protein
LKPSPPGEDWRGRRIGLPREGERRPPEVVIADVVRARPHLVQEVDLAGELLLGRLVGVVDPGQRRGARRARLQRVTERERRPPAPVVGEGVGDARLLQQPGEEGVIALPVLRLVLELGVPRALDAPHRLQAPLGEQAVDDVRDRLVLVDPVAATLGEEPQRGHEAELVGRQPGGLGLHLLDVVAHPRPAPRGAVEVNDAAHQPERGGLADDRLEVDLERRARHDRDREGPGDRLVDAKVAHRERRLPGLEGELGDGHGPGMLSHAGGIAKRPRDFGHEGLAATPPRGPGSGSVPAANGGVGPMPPCEREPTRCVSMGTVCARVGGRRRRSAGRRRAGFRRGRSPAVLSIPPMRGRCARAS